MFSPSLFKTFAAAAAAATATSVSIKKSIENDKLERKKIEEIAYQNFKPEEGHFGRWEAPKKDYSDALIAPTLRAPEQFVLFTPSTPSPKTPASATEPGFKEAARFNLG